MKPIDEPIAPARTPEYLHPFLCRHVLREARRRKRALYDPNADQGWRITVEDCIASAVASGFVTISTNEILELTREGIAELARLERYLRE